MKFHYSKFFIILPTILMVLVGVFCLTEKAEAQMVVIDPAHIGVNIAGWIEDIAMWIKDELIATIRDRIVKMIIDMMTAQIVDWIQGGGEPQFVSDFGGFLSDAFGNAVGEVIYNQENLRFLCSPLRSPLLSVFLPQGGGFRQQVRCTLDDIVKNIEDFYNDFSKGGWLAYNEMWRPQNNYYGQVFTWYDELLAKGTKAQKAAENEALAGKGFLSQKRCLEWDNTSRSDCYASCVETGEVSEICDAQCSSIQPKCKKSEIVTPGDVVGEAAANVIGAQKDYVVNIKSIISAIVNAAINRLMKEGLGLMKNVISGGGGSGPYSGKMQKDPVTGKYNSVYCRDLSDLSPEAFKVCLERTNNDSKPLSSNDLQCLDEYGKAKSETEINLLRSCFEVNKVSEPAITATKDSARQIYLEVLDFAEKLLSIKKASLAMVEEMLAKPLCAGKMIGNTTLSDKKKQLSDEIEYYQNIIDEIKGNPDKNILGYLNELEQENDPVKLNELLQKAIEYQNKFNSLKGAANAEEDAKNEKKDIEDVYKACNLIGGGGGENCNGPWCFPTEADCRNEPKTYPLDPPGYDCRQEGDQWCFRYTGCGNQP